MKFRNALFVVAFSLLFPTSLLAEEAPQPTEVVVTSTIGYLDVANCSIIGGWSVDFNHPNSSTLVAVVADAEYGARGSRWIGLTDTSGGFRPDVNAAFSIEGNHGFTILTPVALKDGLSHPVYAYGLDNVSGSLVKLTNSPITVSCGLTVSAYVTGEDGQPLDSRTWPNPSVSMTKRNEETGAMEYVAWPNWDTNEGMVMNGNVVFRGATTEDPNTFTPFTAGHYGMVITAAGKQPFYREFDLSGSNHSLGSITLRDYPVQVELSNIRQEGETLLADIVVRNTATVPMDLQQYGQYAPSYAQAYMYSYYFGEGQSASGTVAMTIPTDQPKGWQVCIGFAAVERGKSSNKLGESAWGCVVVR